MKQRVTTPRSGRPERAALISWTQDRFAGKAGPGNRAGSWLTPSRRCLTLAREAAQVLPLTGGQVTRWPPTGPAVAARAVPTAAVHG